MVVNWRYSLLESWYIAVSKATKTWPLCIAWRQFHQFLHLLPFYHCAVFMPYIAIHGWSYVLLHHAAIMAQLFRICQRDQSSSARASSQCKHKMQCCAAFEVVLLRCLVVAHLLAAIDESLLGRRDALLLFNTLLDLADLVIGLDVEFDFLAGQGTDFDLHIE